MTWFSEHLDYRRVEVAERKRQLPEIQLRAQIDAQLGALATARAFPAALAGGNPASIAVIAEVKFRSPSMGQLRPQLDVEVVAEGYHRAGAAALSVLVDGVHFGGELSFLGRARAACPLPILAKGFFVDPYDLLEVRFQGADAALLIARALTRTELETMLGTARAIGLATLMELHDEDDLAKVEGLELDCVGVNHRNLATLEMDAGLSARLAPRLPQDCRRVAESGLGHPSDLLRMAALGYDAVLVGTAFMSQPDPGVGLARLLEELHGFH